LTASGSQHEPVLEARLPNGELLDVGEVSTFELVEVTGTVIPVITDYPDGSRVLRGELRMTPLRPDLNVAMRIFVSGVAFEDGGPSLALTSDDFTPDPDATDGAAVAYFKLIVSADTSVGPCHTRAVYHLNTQVGGD
jgi:hypothetical protein